ncbi:AAA family ATPase [uncultured Roseobacter sp.]|uniref:AAA family ATPase n=1 Tax=uncultured Roseobacter sp. TaxID=114847 RepID=UPI00260D9041|nr:AAA family ATPase [uncultured Roseobacter sp.]
MIFRFLTFTLDTERRELRDDMGLVPLSPKAFDVLCYLIEHQDRVVPKSELLDAFWSAQVSEAALQKTISLIRKATTVADNSQEVLKTYHGLGFRFVAAAQERPQTPSPALVGNDAEAIVVREQRLAAVLSLRIGHSGGQVGADDPPPLSDEFLGRAREIVDQYQGHLLRMVLEGFTVSFGLGGIYEDGARRAAHCALALLDCADMLGPGAVVSIGIDTGTSDVVAGEDMEKWAPPGGIERKANALSKAAARGEIILSAATHDQLRDEIESVQCPAGFRLISIPQMQSGVPARPRKKPAAFVGRRAEMAFLLKNLELVQTGDGQGVVLSGPAGIGKTRLVSEFLKTLDEAGVRHIKLQCLPSLINSPRAPIRDMCLSLFSPPPEGTLLDDVDTALLQDLYEEPNVSKTALAALSDHQRRQRSLVLIDRMLAASCESQPMVLVIEDTHWIDATSQEYLEAMLRDIGRKRLMIVMTTRPTDTASLTEGVLHLAPLGRADSVSLLQQNADNKGFDETTSEQLVRRAAGNPFFIEELALACQVGADPSTDLPDTVQAVIAVRIGALDAGLRTLLYVIAVIGTPARIELMMLLLGKRVEEVEHAVEPLIRMGFIQAEPDGYTFRHMLIHDTACSMVAPRDRKRLHADIAALLEEEVFDWTPRPERLAWHHQEAGARRKAISYWIAASRDALHRSARREAIAFARDGLALIDADMPDAAKEELDLQLCLAPALAALRGYGAVDVGEAYYRARVLNRGVGSTKSEIRVLVGLWIHTWVSGRLTESLGHAGKLLDIAASVREPALDLQAEASMGQVLLHRGETQKALGHLMSGLRSTGGAPPATLPAQNSAVACAAYAAWTTSLSGDVERAKAYIERSAELSEVHENPFAQAIHFALCSEPYMFMGDAAGCLALADRAVVVSREHNFDFWLSTGLVMRGWALGQLQDFEPAFEAMDEGIAVFEAAGAGVQLANWYGLQAETFLAADQPEAGLEAAQHALTCAQKAEDVFFTPRIHATAARLHRMLGAESRASEHSQKASDLIRAFGMTPRFLDLADTGS